MKSASVQAIIRALNDSGVRFLVAGGLAVNAHGYLRFTKDADLVIDLEPTNIAALFTSVQALGYRPLAPVTAEQFGNPELRARLAREKGMQVLQFYSDAHRETPIDVFVTEPFGFDGEFERALVKDLPGAGPVRFVRLDTHPDEGSDWTTAGLCRRPAASASARRTMTELPAEFDDFDWQLTTWEGSRREQLRRWAELPFERVLAALEEMEDLARALGSLPRDGSSPPQIIP